MGGVHPSHCKLPLRSQTKLPQTRAHTLLLARLPVAGRSALPAASNCLPGFPCFLRVAQPSSHPICHLVELRRLSICRRTADGATTKNHCRDLFTPPNTRESDKYQFIGFTEFSRKEKLFQHGGAERNSNTSNKPVPPVLP